MECETTLTGRAAAFDALAGDYDAEFTASALGRTLRTMVWERYAAAFPGRQSLLELGCGTGEDAIWFAKHGHRVLAIDASEQMVRVAAQKASQAGVADRLRFLCLPMERLHELPGETFDGVYSNFGAVNCVAREDLARLLASRVRPGAALLWVVMGRYVPWEMGWYCAHGDPRRAFRRLRRGGTAWRGLRVTYPTPARLARELRPHFTARRHRALGFALPPSYAAGWLDRSPRSLAWLTRAERQAQRLSPLAAWSDHYIFEAERAE
jgi:SAM-dependent methyltransferase